MNIMEDEFDNFDDIDIGAIIVMLLAIIMIFMDRWTNIELRYELAVKSWLHKRKVGDIRPSRHT